MTHYVVDTEQDLLALLPPPLVTMIVYVLFPLRYGCLFPCQAYREVHYSYLFLHQTHGS